MRLKQARTKANISQKDLGISIGLDPSSASGRMNHYEKGRHTPDLQTLKRLSEKLGVPLNYFFCETEDMADLVLFFNSLSKKDKIKFLEKIKMNDNV